MKAIMRILFYGSLAITWAINIITREPLAVILYLIPLFSLILLVKALQEER